MVLKNIRDRNMENRDYIANNHNKYKKVKIKTKNGYLAEIDRWGITACGHTMYVKINYLDLSFFKKIFAKKYFYDEEIEYFEIIKNK